MLADVSCVFLFLLANSCTVTFRLGLIHLKLELCPLSLSFSHTRMHTQRDVYCKHCNCTRQVSHMMLLLFDIVFKEINYGICITERFRYGSFDIVFYKINSTVPESRYLVIRFKEINYLSLYLPSF